MLFIDDLAQQTEDLIAKYQQSQAEIAKLRLQNRALRQTNAQLTVKVQLAKERLKGIITTLRGRA